MWCGRSAEGGSEKVKRDFTAEETEGSEAGKNRTVPPYLQKAQMG
jgi:hypothetical protein